jgi:hypothetical protein
MYKVTLVLLGAAIGGALTMFLGAWFLHIQVCQGTAYCNVFSAADWLWNPVFRAAPFAFGVFAGALLGERYLASALEYVGISILFVAAIVLGGYGFAASASPFEFGPGQVFDTLFILVLSTGGTLLISWMGRLLEDGARQHAKGYTVLR